MANNRGSSVATPLAGVGALAAAFALDRKFRLINDARLGMNLLPTLIALRRRLRLSSHSLADVWMESVRRFGSETFIVFEHRRMTFQDVDRVSNQMAHLLRQEGFQPGQALALMMENKPEYVCWWLAMAKIGVKVALLNYNLTGRGLAHCLCSAVQDCLGVVFDGECEANLHTIDAALHEHRMKLFCWGGQPRRSFQAPVLAVDYDQLLGFPYSGDGFAELRRGIKFNDVFGYIYTSGTTGLPKAAKILHSKMYSLSGICGILGLGPGDRLYTCLPLYHSAGGGLGTMSCLVSGATLVLARKFSASRFWTEISEQGCTAFQYIGELGRYLVNYAREHPEVTQIPHKLKGAVGNGLRPEVWDEFQDKFNIPVVTEFYGATEGNAALLNYCRKTDLASRGAIGKGGFFFDKALLGFTARLRGCAVRIETSPGEAGELICPIDDNHPTRRFEGYTDSKATEKKVLRDVFTKGDAWFRTGDLLSKDSSGLWYFVDRIGDTFRWKGENVSTMEVSQVLSSFPGVEEANVYGVQGSFVAFLTEEECHVVDVQAAFAAAAWSPWGVRGPLLAILDSVGRLFVTAPCDHDMGSTKEVTDLKDSALVDLSEDFERATKRESRASILDLCFWPSPICLEGKKRVAALLCACRGSSVVIWKLGPKFDGPHRLRRVVLEPSVEITAVAASSIWQSLDGSLISLLAMATSTGQVHVHRISVDSDGCELASTPLCETPIFDVGLGSIGQLAVLTDISDEIEVFLAVGRGVHVSAAVLRCSKRGNLKQVSAYTASVPCHAVPVVSVLCAAGGILSQTDARQRNANILSMDSSGQGVLWQLPCNGSGTGTLDPGRLCSLVPGSWQNWLTTVEQNALRLDARMVRAAAREREARRGSSLFCGLAMSPSHCLLAMQTVIVSERTTQQRMASSLLITPVGSPLHSFNASLRSLLQAVHQSQVSFFCCSLWDVAESWQIQTQRKFTGFPFKSPKDLRMSQNENCLERCIEWIWGLAEIFTRVAEAEADAAEKATLGSLGFRSASKQAVHAALRDFVPKSLAERRRLLTAHPLGGAESLQALQALCLRNADRLLHLCRDVDLVSVKRLQNACLEFVRFVTSAPRGRSEKDSKLDVPAAASWKGCWLLSAVTRDYWKCRLAKACQTPLGSAEQLLAYLSNPDQVPGESDGRACMAALNCPEELQSREKLDAVQALCEKELPGYARPLFLRFLPSMEITGTFKHQKVHLRNEGIDLTKVQDPIYVLHPASKRYERLDAAMLQVMRGAAREERRGGPKAHQGAILRLLVGKQRLYGALLDDQLSHDAEAARLATSKRRRRVNGAPLLLALLLPWAVFVLCFAMAGFIFHYAMPLTATLAELLVVAVCLQRVFWGWRLWKRGAAEGFYPAYMAVATLLAAVVGWCLLSAQKGLSLPTPSHGEEGQVARLYFKFSRERKKKAAAPEPVEEIPADLKELTIPNLRDRIDAFQYRLSKAAKDRNYMQLEKDMVNRFYEITKSEVKQVEAELLNMDRKMEILERDFRVHIKVHEQKVQNLEYEQKEAKRQVGENGDMDLQKARDLHSEQLLNMNKEKLELKRDIRETQLENEDEVKMMLQGFAKRLQNLRDTFEQNHLSLQAQYEEQVEQLKIDLELRRKVEIHEIEERKNQHINELLFNHQEAFDEIKAYYNDITHDNLQLIKSLKDEIFEMKEKEKTNKKKMDLLRQENRDLTRPLEEKLKQQRALEEELKTYTKDKMALKNLKAHFKKLEEQITEAKQEYRTCEDKYRKMEKERDDLYKRFKKAVQEIQRKAELGKNVVLEKKLETLAQQFDEKQAQLTEVLTNARLDPTIVANVTKKLEQVLGAKNRQIKDLQYQVHQSTKQYNDTIRVYESKLQGLGVDPEEIGFEAIQTATSLMPARLVTRVG
ncbi:Slc27a4 [Symbiodinium necroappetens]|uniref:Slc27a4 protein n=1 Tax=Symbiodinium necroappetens TaxID=1628268 RepID=A0A812N3F9_9DINO|nr:Slc27a4 [Symbiodinium necroappetens]